MFVTGDSDKLVPAQLLEEKCIMEENKAMNVIFAKKYFLTNLVLRSLGTGICCAAVAARILFNQKIC